MLQLLDPQNLDVDLIQNLLNNTSITQSFNVQNKEFYLYLLADTKFYLDQIPKVSVFSLELFFEIYIEQSNLESNINKQIEIDEILQHLIRYEIVKEDLGTIIIANINFGDFLFLIGMVNTVDNNIVTVIPFGQQISDLELEWIKIPLFSQKILKDKILQKNVKFTQKIVLKKK
jgi:hypothetical protein